MDVVGIPSLSVQGFNRYHSSDLSLTKIEGNEKGLERSQLDHDRACICIVLAYMLLI